MNEKDMMRMKESFAMPSEMADALPKGCTVPGKLLCHSRSGRHRLLTAAAAAVFCMFAVGSTSLAYNIYQEKQLAVFMNADLSQEDIDRLGQEIAGICEISSCQYIGGSEAWEEFKAAYLTDENGAELTELTEGFGNNPLADSFNYRVSVRMSADTQAVRDQISGLPGVRKVTTLRDLERDIGAK